MVGGLFLYQLLLKQESATQSKDIRPNMVIRNPEWLSGEEVWHETCDIS